MRDLTPELDGWLRIAEDGQHLRQGFVGDVVDLVDVHEQEASVMETGAPERQEQVAQHHLGRRPLPRIRASTTIQTTHAPQRGLDRGLAALSETRRVGDAQQRPREQGHGVDTAGNTDLLGDEVPRLGSVGGDATHEGGLADARLAEECPAGLPLAPESPGSQAVAPVGQLVVPAGPDARDSVTAWVEGIHRRVAHQPPQDQIANVNRLRVSAGSVRRPAGTPPDGRAGMTVLRRPRHEDPHQ